jgi:titin
MKKIIAALACLLLFSPVWAATYTVTNTNDDGAGSLNQAITDANNNPGADTIEFNIPTADAGYTTEAGVSFWRIKPTSVWPALNDLSDGGTTIDGSTQTTNQGDTNPYGPEIVIDDSYGAGKFGMTANNNTIKNLVINNALTTESYIEIRTSNNRVSGCYIGTDATGSAVLNSGNGWGIFISNGGKYNIIGGNTETERNIISLGNASGGTGITIGFDRTGNDHNQIKGNYIGTDRTGTVALGNKYGINFGVGAQYNIIGGSNAGEGNVISGNPDGGIILQAGTDHTTIEGNYIGVDAGGNTALANSIGLAIGSAYNIIGGSQKNVISGNTTINLMIGASSNEVKGNYIGVGADGNTSLLSPGSIVLGITSPEAIQYNIIGGSTAAERNVIASATSWLTTIFIGGNYNQVKGNYIGTNATATSVIERPGDPSFGNAIWLAAGCHNSIGGADAGERNIIAGTVILTGNFGGSIYVTNSNEVTNNYFGLDPTGTIPLGTNFPVYFSGEAQHNRISSNTFAYFGTGSYWPGGSGQNVIWMLGEPVKYNTVTKNIFINNNVPEMISLGHGANNSISPPVIYAVAGDGVNTTVSGTAPAASIIEVFQAAAPSSEAVAYLGSVEADALGNWSFIASGVFSSHEVTATATDRSGNTSQFSLNSVTTTTTTTGSTTTTTTTTASSTTTTTLNNNFTVVQIEATPAVINLEFNDPTGDNVTLLIVAPGPPPRVVKEVTFTSVTVGNNLLSIPTIALSKLNSNKLLENS